MAESMTMKIKIRPDFRSLIPPLSEEERNTLELNIKRDGCHDPLMLWQSGSEFVLLDGHNRYDICNAAGIAFQTALVDGVQTEAEAMNWMIENQLGRRNLTTAQKINLLMHRREVVKESQPKGGRPKKGEKPCLKRDTVSERRTTAVIAREAGVSRATVERTVAVLKSDNEILKKEMLEDKKKPSAAYAELKTGKPPKPRKKKAERGGVHPDASKPVIGLTEFKPRRNMDIYHDTRKAAQDIIAVMGREWSRELATEIHTQLETTHAPHATEDHGVS